MRVEWNCAEQLETIKTVRLDLFEGRFTGEHELLEGGGSTKTRQIIGNRDRVHELYQLDTWMVEAASPEAGNSQITFFANDTEPYPIAITFGIDPIDEAVLTVIGENGNQLQKTMRDVESIQIANGLLTASCAGGDVGQQHVQEVEATAGLESSLAEELAAEKEKSDALSSALSDAEKQMATSSRLAAELQKQLDAERLRCSSLQGIAASNLEQALANAKAARDQLSQDLQDRLDSIESVQGEIDALNSKIENAEARKAELAAERERLEPLEEARTLDCEQANAELEEMRSRFDANAATVELMQTDEFLIGNSVRKTLSKVIKELESIEKRIGLIITYRESFLGAVQQAMVNGDGSLPLDKDLERGYDGDGGEPETQDQGA